MLYTPCAENTQKVLVMVHACYHHLSVHSNIFKDMTLCFSFHYVVLSLCLCSSVAVEYGAFNVFDNYVVKDQLSENITGGRLCLVMGMMNFYYI